MSVILLALTVGVAGGYLLVILILKAFTGTRRSEAPPAVPVRAESAGD